MLKVNKNLSDEMLFEKTKKSANKEFHAALEQELLVAASRTSAKNVFVFIDKNHPPNSIENAIDAVRRAANKEFNLSICAIVQEGVKNEKYVINSAASYPLSLNFLLNCISRVQTRKKHPTLPGNG